MVKGHHDFNSHPIAPAGCKVIIHDRRSERKSWDNHGTNGFYVSQAPRHYRNFTCYIPSTGATRISDTVEFYPTHCDLPTNNTLDTISLILGELKQVLSEKKDTHFGSNPTQLRRAINSLQDLFTNTTTRRDPVSTSKGASPNKKAGRSVNIYPTGTIIRKKFNKGWFEGEVTGYDPKERYYSILYTDGDTEEFTHNEVKTHKKLKQQYSSNPQNTDQLTNRARYYAQLSRLKARRSKGYSLVNQIHQEATDELFSAAYQAHISKKLQQARKAGSIWDINLKKWMSLKDLLQHPDPKVREIWEKSSCKEYGSLFQGHGDTEGMNVLTFIPKEDVPPDAKVTYPRTTVAYRPEKDDQNRTRITAGGDQLEYDGDTATHSASMTTIKCHWNSVLSTKYAKYATADLKNMYLKSWLPKPQYVRFRYCEIPHKIKVQYNLASLVHNGYVYARIDKAWYGLKEAGKIANDDVISLLATHGYHQSKHTSGLFTHTTRDISFTLVVDDFGIKYQDKADLDHLMMALKTKYDVTLDLDAKQYVGIDLTWNYDCRELLCSMDEYAKEGLSEFQHPAPKQFH